MLLQAAREMGIELAGSYLIGDATSDIQAAVAVGCFPILVLSGRGEAAHFALTGLGYHRYKVVRDLPAAVDWILQYG